MTVIYGVILTVALFNLVGFTVLYLSLRNAWEHLEMCERWILSHHNLLPDHNDFPTRPKHPEWRIHGKATRT